MKISSCACLLLVAVSALAPRAASAVDIDYTVTGLTAWNGLTFQNAAFDPPPELERRTLPALWPFARD